jgi:hypothetical protein
MNWSRAILFLETTRTILSDTRIVLSAIDSNCTNLPRTVQFQMNHHEWKLHGQRDRIHLKPTETPSQPAITPLFYSWLSKFPYKPMVLNGTVSISLLSTDIITISNHLIEIEYVSQRMDSLIEDLRF